MHPIRHELPSMQLELVKAALRRYVPAAIVESVVKRALVTNHLDVRSITLDQLELVVANSIAGLHRIVDSKVMSTLVIELSEILAEVSDECEANPVSSRGYGSMIRMARHGR